MNTRKLILASAIIGAIVLFIESLRPLKAVPIVHGISPSGFLFHIAAYAVLTILFLESRNTKTKYFYVITIVLISAYGILIEILQGFTLTRTPSFLDSLANSIGIALSTLLITFINVKPTSK